MTSRSNNTKNENLKKKNISKENNIEVQPAQNTEEEKSKKVLSCSNSKQSININKEKDNVPNRNKGNNMNSMLTYSSTAIIDENILKNMENFGYKKEYIQKCLNNNDINYCTATYYLLSSSSEIIT